MNEVIRDYRICKNPLGVALHENKRYTLTPQPREEQVFKHNKVKTAGLPEVVKDTDVFDYNFYKNGNKKVKTKQMKPLKKDKRFDTKRDNKNTRVTQKNLY